MQEISKQEYLEFFKWLFGENVEIKEEFDITMAKDYQDPNIYYTKEIYDLFQTKAMKRLEKITHLGAEFLLNTNAYHNRLEHSKGAYRRCIEFLATQYRNNEWKEYIENSGQKGYLVETIKFMCTHDIGHSILSHSIEALVGNENCTHEDIGNKIRQEDPEVINALQKIKVNEIKSNEKDNSLRLLCEGNIDFDRYDFLSRDALFTGEEDTTRINEIIQKLNSACSLGTLEDGTKAYVYENEAIEDIEKFLIFRKEMYEKEYRNKNTGTTEKHLRSVLERVLESNEKSEIKDILQGFYNKEIDEIDIDNYLKTDDIQFFNALIKLMEETQDEQLKALIESIIPNAENAFNLAVNMINPKNKDKDKYTKGEKQFIENVRRIINRELKCNTSINDYVLSFESCDERMLDEIAQIDAIEKYSKKIKIYNPKEPIYVKDKEGKIIKFDEYPYLSINIEPETIYGVLISVPKLLEQGYTQENIDIIVNKLRKYEIQDSQDKKTISDTSQKDIHKTFEKFFEDR